MQLTSLDDAAWASPWRRRSVGTKVLGAVGLVLTALLAPVWPGSVLVALVSMGLILFAAKIRFRVLVIALSVPLLFILTSAIPVMISIGHPQSDVWWSWWYFSLSPHGMQQAFNLVGHGIAGTLAIFVLAITTPMVDLLTWLRKLRVPDQLLEVASLTYRLLFVLADTMLAVADAQRFRLAEDAPFLRRLRYASDAVGSVAIRSWHQAQRLNEGMMLRGYESSLTTVGIKHERSLSFVLLFVGLITGIWGLCLVMPH